VDEKRTSPTSDLSAESKPGDSTGRTISASDITEVMDGQEWMTAKEIASKAARVDEATRSLVQMFYNRKSDDSELRERIESRPDPDDKRRKQYRFAKDDAEEAGQENSSDSDTADTESEEDAKYLCPECGSTDYVEKYGLVLCADCAAKIEDQDDAGQSDKAEEQRGDTYFQAGDDGRPDVVEPETLVAIVNENNGPIRIDNLHRELDEELSNEEKETVLAAIKSHEELELDGHHVSLRKTAECPDCGTNISRIQLEVYGSCTDCADGDDTEVPVASGVSTEINAESPAEESVSQPDSASEEKSEPQEFRERVHNERSTIHDISDGRVNGKYVCLDCGCGFVKADKAKQHEINIHGDDYDQNYRKVKTIPEEEAAERWIVTYRNPFSTEWKDPRVRKARKKRAKTVLGQKDYALDLKQIREAMGQLYSPDSDNRRCFIDASELEELLKELVEEGVLQQDGQTWALSG
jgi:ribosomal protein L37AE/L43A